MPKHPVVEKSAIKEPRLAWHIGAAEKSMWVSAHRLPHLYRQTMERIEQGVEQGGAQRGAFGEQSDSGMLNMSNEKGQTLVQSVEADGDKNEHSYNKLKKYWLIGAHTLGFMCTLLLSGTLIIEAVRLPLLYHKQAQVQREVDLFKEEQRFLTKKTKLPERFIGVSSVFGFDKATAYYQHEGAQILNFTGYNFLSTLGTDILKSTGLFKNVGVIGLGANIKGQDEAFVRFAARHEMAHQWQQEERLGLAAWSSVPKMIKLQDSGKSSEVPMLSQQTYEQLHTMLVVQMDAQWQTLWGSKSKQYDTKMNTNKGEQQNGNGSTKLKVQEGQAEKESFSGLDLLYQTYIEAYADAYALLIKTKDVEKYKPGQMHHEALMQMKGRIYGLTKNSIGSEMMSGDGHSVAEVGEQVLQLDEQQVQKLTEQEIQTLAQALSLRATLISFGKSASYLAALDEKQRFKWLQMQEFAAQKNAQPIDDGKRAQWEEGFKQLRTAIGYDEDLSRFWSELYPKDNEKHWQQEWIDEQAQKMLSVYERSLGMPDWMRQGWQIPVADRKFSGLGELPDPLNVWRTHGMGGLMYLEDKEKKIVSHPMLSMFFKGEKQSSKTPMVQQFRYKMWHHVLRTHMTVSLHWSMQGYKVPEIFSEKEASAQWSMGSVPYEKKDGSENLVSALTSNHGVYQGVKYDQLQWNTKDIAWWGLANGPADLKWAAVKPQNPLEDEVWVTGVAYQSEKNRRANDSLWGTERLEYSGVAQVENVVENIKTNRYIKSVSPVQRFNFDAQVQQYVQELHQRQKMQRLNQEEQKERIKKGIEKYRNWSEKDTQQQKGSAGLSGALGPIKKV